MRSAPGIDRFRTYTERTSREDFSMDGIFSGWHWIIVVIAFVALFGAAKLPIFARSLGQSMRIFKSKVRGLKEDDAAAAGTVTPQAAITPAAPPVVAPGVGQATPTAQ